MPKKLGVYICSGCTIGEAVDTQKLAKVAQGQYKIGNTKIHPVLCGAEGRQLIADDIAANGVNAVVIAACSPRARTEAFCFDNGTLVERVNLREQVAWCQKPNDEDTQMLAEDYLRMGIVKTQKSEAPQALADTISKTVLVVGGGTTGINAALGAAEAGYDVVIVEKEAELGGFAAGLKRRFSSTEDLTEKIRQATEHPRIRVFTSAAIARTEGQPGMFDVTIDYDSGSTSLRAGAIIMATGWKPYDASKLAHLGYGLTPDVITNVELEKMAAKGPILRPSDGRPVEDVLFVQCAGSRDKEHLSYCSSVCCMATLKHAGYIREQNPNANVFIVYKDIRATGEYERLYRAAQDDPLTFLTKGEVTRVDRALEGKLGVTIKDTLFGENVILQADLVVLATGMVPNSADGEAIRALEDALVRSAKAESETQRAEFGKKVVQLEAHKGTEILNLTYRQGPDLPVLRNGFPDSHFICFPYETRRTAIYAAGALRAPMDAARAEDDGLGAAMKAIQSVEMASQGQAVHPRAGDLSFPSFLLQRCTQCKRCTEECPFGALDEDEKGTPKPNLYRCRRCGICMGACPERIISFKNYSVDIIASMIKSIEVPDEDEEKPRIVAFLCENDAYPALDTAGLHRLSYDPSIRVIPLRCLGSLNIVWIADALSSGFDGVMLAGCKYGDDYQCHFVKGSELANRRLENVKETLQRLQLESDRLLSVELAMNEWEKLPGLMNDFAARIRELGPNPYKGF